MFRKDIIIIVVVGTALLGLLGYHAVKGTEVPLWQALLVVAVNLLAAGKLFLSVKKARGGHPPGPGVDKDRRG